MRTHLENIYDKLHVSSRTAAVTRAFPTGPPSAYGSAGGRVVVLPFLCRHEILLPAGDGSRFGRADRTRRPQRH